MKQGVRLSINQLATFTAATEAKRKRIILQQKNPSPIIVSWYGSAKSAMRNFYKDPSNTKIIEEGLAKLKESKPKSTWHNSNKKGSIEILQRFIKMSIPKCFVNENISFLKPALKSLSIFGVEIIAAPELLFYIDADGARRYGAVKFHTSKTGKFTGSQSLIVSTALKLYLRKYINQFDKGAIVDEQYCLCVDVFNETITAARKDSSETEETIKETCREVIKLWDNAA